MKRMDSGRPVIELRNVRLKLGGRAVLDGLSFDVKRGEVFVIIGYSGSGKSVTLQNITGLMKPDAGSIRIIGEQIVGLSEREMEQVRRRFGYLFQSGALINWLTVAQNVELPLREHSAFSARKRREVVAEKLRLVALENDGGKYPSELSGGMRKRAGLARALALDPEVLLLDEPTSGLDPVLAHQIDDLVLEINRRLRISCIVVTHDMDSAYGIATRIGFFCAGRMHAIGTPEEIRASTDPEIVRFVTGGRGGRAESPAGGEKVMAAATQGAGA